MNMADKAKKAKKPLSFFTLPWPIFLVVTAITLLATYLGVLPAGMAGCFLFMMVVGEILGWIGDHAPIIKDYLGGGAIVCIFGSALLVYFGLIPAFNNVSAKYTPAKEQTAVVALVDKAVDNILITQEKEAKLVDGETYTATAEAEETVKGEDGKETKVTRAVTVSAKVKVEEKDGKRTVSVDSLSVEPGENISDEVKAYVTGETFTGYYKGAKKASDRKDPIGKTVTAVNGAVNAMLKDSSVKREPGKVYKSEVVGYGSQVLKIEVTFDENKAIKTITVNPAGLPDEVAEYVAGEDFSKQYVGKKGWNMLLPFGNLDLVSNIGTFFKTTGGFLDWYIAALITGSILGMNRKLLMKAAARYFPAIFGGLILAFGLCMGVAALMGYPVMNALLLISLPIMGGGMGAGATPLSKIFEASSSMSAAQALSVMTPAVAIGNAISIVLAGVLVKVIKGKLNGNGQLMQAGSVDPKELEISPEMQQKRDHLDLKSMGVGLLVSGAFFAWGFILQGAWNALGTGITIHAYAWMIITVAICKITNIVPERIEIACYQWFQFVMKNLTNMLLVGIGICYLDIATVISSFSLTYLLLCAATCIGAFVGAAFIGKLVGFYPFESGITAGLCMSNMGGTGDVAVLSAADRMELMPFAQISSRLGGAVILLLASLMLSILAQFLAPLV